MIREDSFNKALKIPLSDKYLHFFSLISHAGPLFYSYFYRDLFLFISGTAGRSEQRSGEPALIAGVFGRVIEQTVFIGSFDWMDAWNLKMEHYHTEDGDSVKSLWNVWSTSLIMNLRKPKQEEDIAENLSGAEALLWSILKVFFSFSFTKLICIHNL